MKEHTYYMQIALSEVDTSIKSGSEPFAVVVVDNLTGEIIHKNHDRVVELCDPTAHSEINAIRFLCKKINKTKLPHVTFYTSSEPCVTCLSAMIKAQIPFVYYGAKTERTASLPIDSKELAKHSKNPIVIIGGILEEKALEQRNTFYRN